MLRVRAGMVNLAAMVWRRLLRKRWVLALVFGLSLVYFLSSTFKQVSGCPPPSRLCSPGRLAFPRGGGSRLCSRAASVSEGPVRRDRGRAKGPAHFVGAEAKRRC